jgi:hypothetical protein
MTFIPCLSNFLISLYLIRFVLRPLSAAFGSLFHVDDVGGHDNLFNVQKQANPPSGLAYA